MTMRLDALVLSMETRAGLAAARSLGRSGYRLGIGSWGRRAPGMRTRYAAARVVLPSPSDGSETCARVIAGWLSEHPADVCLTSTDAGLTILNEYRELISRVAAPAIASPEAIRIALSKQATLEIADSLKIPYPRSLPVSSLAETEAALEELGLPAVIKPVHQWHRDEEAGTSEYTKPRLVETLDEARAVALEMVKPETPALVQELVTGGRFEHHQFFRDRGRIIARVTIGVDRQWPPFGISAMRTTIAPPEDTGKWAEDLVAAIGIDGCSSVQFKRDEQGRARLMEVNARLVQTLAVATQAGVDFARLQLEWARGGRLEPLNGYRIGVRVGWLGGDLRLLASSLGLVKVKPKPAFRPTIRSIANSYLRQGTRIEGFDLRDPLPMLASTAEFASSAARDVLGRLSSSLRR